MRFFLCLDKSMSKLVYGAKADGGKARKPVVAQDSAQSKTYIKILYGLSEGPIKGLVDGVRSIYLDDTPLQDANGIWNFNNVTVDYRLGTNDQTYIEGFPDISSETGIGVELKSKSAWVKGFTNTELDALRIRLRWGPLRQQNMANGDVKGITILYAIDLQTDGGTWTEVLNTRISDKTSANYERSHRIDLPKADFGWQVRVRRITPNANSEAVSDKMYVQAITEVIDAKLRYPNTALLGLQYDAETFSNVAKMAAECEGVEILIPSNYNPITREYAGLWDGTFKRAYTNNPAWHFYDACIAKRYALGDRINSSMIDKWSIYRLGQYCDQLVPDGKGGLEPRFTLNVYEQSQDDAWTVLSKMAGAFRAYIYWDGQAIVCDADIPQDTYYTYTAANVIDGHFEYSGTRARDRHTVAKAAWDNPNNRYKTEYLYVRDEAAIARLGIRIVEIAAYGCTSEGQAQRAGHWALKSEQYETRMVTFKVGLDGFIPRPGKVIEIADPLFAGRANGGRIAAVNADLKQITLDRDDVVCRAGDRLVVNSENGVAQARIVQSIIGRVVTVVSAFESVAAESVWVVDAQDLATMKFRVISMTQDDKHQFTINALQYNAAKYDAIDNGAFIDERPISIINPKLQKPVESVTVSSDEMVQQGLTVATMHISWPQAEGATKYQVEWRKDDGSWIKLPITGSNSVEVQGIYAGNYQARVIAINAFDITSLATYSILTTLKGKAGKPPKLAFVNATGILFGIQLNWGFPEIGALDTAYTEIRVSPDGESNIALLGQFAYPTNAHTIQGLQPNLTQYYQGRLIDRIGNIGDWSDWVHATTSADSSAILELLDGQISESQLDQALKEKIDSDEKIQEVLDKVNAQWYVKIDNGNAVSGIGLGLEDDNTTQFLVRANRFAIAPPAEEGDEGKYAFVYQATAETLPNGTVIPPGLYLDSAVMRYQSVTEAHIQDLAVKTAKIDNLAVTTAQIDDLAVTGAKIDDLAVDTLKIKDNAVTIPVSAFAEVFMGVGGEYATIQTLYVPSDMGHTILTFGAVFSFSSYTSQQRLLCRVLKNGNVVFEDLEVHFIDYDSVGVTSSNGGSHQHGLFLNITGSASSAGGHDHSFSGSTSNTSISGVSNSSHSHNYSGRTNTAGAHTHSLNLDGTASMGVDGIHRHDVVIRGSARSAGTLNISRHDSTGIAGLFELQLKSTSGGIVNVSQRYIHAMTMRK